MSNDHETAEWQAQVVVGDLSIKEREVVENRDYDRGFLDALECFSHWRDGKQYVGTCGQTLKDAVASRRTLGYYRP